MATLYPLPLASSSSSASSRILLLLILSSSRILLLLLLLIFSSSRILLLLLPLLLSHPLHPPSAINHRRPVPQHADVRFELELLEFGNGQAVTQDGFVRLLLATRGYAPAPTSLLPDAFLTPTSLLPHSYSTPAHSFS